MNLRITTLNFFILCSTALPVGLAGCMFFSGCASSDAPAPPEEDTDISGEPVPLRDGMTVCGRVTSEGKALEGVAVSDGLEVTLTDEKGLYYLPSRKENGFVFVSTPGGYEPEMSGNMPMSWKRLDAPADSTEVVSFTLTPCDNSRHAVLALADFHLARRNNDLEQFADFTRDVNHYADSLKGAGYKVYGLSLGDETWDLYWYSNSFSPVEARLELGKFNFPFYHNMGNHDNNPYVADDRGAEDIFRSVMGPTYYSFNLGDVHYVVLDNIKYRNEGGAEGHIGDRRYSVALAENILTWLRNDLSVLPDKSAPLVIAMHAPLIMTDRSLSPQLFRLSNHEEFLALLEGFGNVTLLTGHVHENCATKVSETITEHNIASVCGTWWWTGKLSGNHICKDGSPGGYGVYMFDGRDMVNRFKPYGFGEDYQFRAYDLNTISFSAKDYAKDLFWDWACGYTAPRTDNEVLINVFDFQPGWTVEVSEEGRQLPVTRVGAYDPLHVLSYNLKRVAAGKAPTRDFATVHATHFFSVHASSPTSTIEIKVTDNHGRTFIQTMERPKPFSESMH